MRKRSFYSKYRRSNLDFILAHFRNNIKEYIIAGIIFLIGILLGAVLVNNLNSLQTENITTYILDSISNIKQNSILNELQMIRENIKQDILFVTLLWIMGSTVIRITACIFVSMF